MRQQQRRSAQTEEEKEAAKEKTRIRRKSTRRGHALANHEDFDKARVSGNNVVNGRHRLPNQFECGWCGAWKWPGESPVSCCLAGRVQLPPLCEVPRVLHKFFGDKAFRDRVRAYNQVFAFTSIGTTRSDGRGYARVNEDRDVQGQRGVYTYRIQGAMGHFMGSLLPHYEQGSNGELAPAKFAQIYIVDPDMATRAEHRQGIFEHLDRRKLEAIEKIMDEINAFAAQYLSFGEKNA